ncbi:hypothetical protein Pfo_006320 [Paulownia fortunei]|nr:hypothetical protein Pfo_006320 [Paulownia fortunei]
MQAAENLVLGQTTKGGPAAVMQSAADVNETRRVVRHEDMTDIVRDQGAVIAETEIAGYRVISECIGGQVVGRYAQPRDVNMADADADADDSTIGEALEATARVVRNKPIDESAAAAIQAAEVRATGLGHVVPGGVAAEAQTAAAYNVRTTRDEQKTKLGDVLADATAKLIDDKPVTREDAEGVISAEVRNKPDMTPSPGGVAAAMAAAAKLNQGK